MTTLDDLIRKGVEIYRSRIEEEYARRKEEEDKLARRQREAEQAILALLPDPLRPLATIGLGPSLSSARLRIDLPSGGRVEVLAFRNPAGWELASADVYYRERGTLTFDSIDPTGYYLRCFSIEEAVAHAAGAIHD